VIKEGEQTVEIVTLDQTTNIKCSNCNKSLMIFYASGEKSEQPLFDLIVDCPFCKDRSFSHRIYNIMKYKMADGVAPGNTETIERKDNIPIKKFLTRLKR
jgi:hypothetical protein